MSRVSKAGAVLAVFTILVCCLVLAGWAFEIDLLKSPSARHAPVRPAVAIGLIFSGIGLLLFIIGRANVYARRLQVIIGTLIALLGAYILAAYILGTPTFTDTLFVQGQYQNPGPIGNRMPPQTAFNFLLLGIALCLSGAKGIAGKIGAMAGIATLVATYAVGLGLLYNSVEFFGISLEHSMAIYVAICFTSLSAGITLANDECNVRSLFLSDTLGGQVARRLLPAVILVPTIVGLLRVMGQDRGYYDTGFGTAMSTFILVLLMFAIVTFYSKAIHKADSKRLEAEDELAANEKRYHDLFAYSQGMICIHDLDGVLRTVNPAVTRAMGYEKEELIGKNLVDFLPEKESHGFVVFLREIKHEGVSAGLLPLVAKSGELIIWRYNSILVTEDNGDQYVVGHAQDVTELISIQKQLRSLSITDELTGLYNRRGFLAMAEQQIKLESHKGTARGLTLMFGDLDGLKQINDLYGHKAGSEAIVDFSKIIKKALRSADIVARWGGDEFVILTIGAKPEDAQSMLDRIDEGLLEHNIASFKPYELSCSIGITPLPLDGIRPLEVIIAEADTAMYKEKRRRKAMHIALDQSLVNVLPTNETIPTHV